MILRVDRLLQGLVALAPVLQHRGLFMCKKPPGAQTRRLSLKLPRENQSYHYDSMDL